MRDRQQWLACLDYLRAGDTLLVRRLDRIAGSEKMAIETINELHERGVNIKSLTEPDIEQWSANHHRRALNTPTMPPPIVTGMEILFLVGSLRRESVNAAAAASAAEMIPECVEATWFGRLDQLPHFDPDLEQTALPESVERLRSMVGDAAGVVVCCPEYAHGASGIMKMALEWLVGGIELVTKPTMLVNVSTSSGGGLRAQRWLEETLTVMGADVRPERVSVAAAGRKVVNGRVVDETALADLRTALDKFVAYAGSFEVGKAAGTLLY